MSLNAIKFPFSKYIDGIPGKSSNEEVIRDDLMQLLLTEPGERVMRPDFGVGLNRLLFEHDPVLIDGLAHKLIRTAIEKFEPRIEIISLTIQIKTEAGGINTLIINLVYSFRGELARLVTQRSLAI